MSNDKVSVPAQDVQALKTYKPLFELGQIVATRAVLSHMEEHAVFPAALLSEARVISSFTVAHLVVWIITESSTGEGKGASTCLLFPEEY